MTTIVDKSKHDKIRNFYVIEQQMPQLKELQRAEPLLALRRLSEEEVLLLTLIYVPREKLTQ